MKDHDEHPADCCLNAEENRLTFTVHEESEAAYRKMLEFLLSVLENGKLKQGFSVELIGGEKSYLHFDDAVLSDTNAFFTTCAHYPNLHSLMKRYVRAVMRGSQYYSDTSDAEEMVPSGGYAAFVLGFRGSEHFDLLREFIQRYDSEHWIAPRNMMYAWIAKFSFTKDTIPVVLDFILCCDDTECRVAKFNHEILQAILDYVDENGREDDIFRIFASISDDVGDFKKQMKRASQSDKPLYRRMLELLSEEDGFEIEVDNTARSQQSFHYPEQLNYCVGENPDLLFFALDTLGKLSHHAKFQKIVSELQKERDTFVTCNFLHVGEVFMLSLVRKPKVDGTAIIIMPTIKQIQISTGEQILLRISYNEDCAAFLTGLLLML